jgi:hypothetical protein
MDLLQSLWLSRSSDAIAGPEIRHLHEEGSNVETLKFFGLSRSNELVAYNPITDDEILDCQEGLTRFLIRVMETAAQTKGDFSLPLPSGCTFLCRSQGCSTCGELAG